MRTAAARSAALQRIDLGMATAASDLRTVCSGEGFFYLKIPANEVAVADRVLSMSRSFFKLPPDVKASLANDASTFYRPRGLLLPGSGPGYRGAALDPNYR